MKQEYPSFSIIIPTFNRPNQLMACLQSLTYLEYPKDRFEVMVVDDGGEKSLDSLISPFQHQINITLITQIHGGAAKARNKGANQARGSYLAFTDDDCIPASDWLQSLSTRFAECPNHAIGGKTINTLSNNSYSTASQMLMDYLFTYYNLNSRGARFISSNNFTLPSYLFYAVGGFDPSFPRAGGEDREFCARWLNHGYGIIYAPEVLVYHTHSLRLSSFWKQHFNYGRGAFQFHQILRGSIPNHSWREPLPFYLNMVCYPFFQEKGLKKSILSLLLIISQWANMAGFILEGINHRIKR